MRRGGRLDTAPSECRGGRTRDPPGDRIRRGQASLAWYPASATAVVISRGSAFPSS
jgi:hypothetical protein